MTRINVGILPHELCDQHLLAEIRELPRAFNYADNKGPEHFKLGTGHGLWCARHQCSLQLRLNELIYEAVTIRGFNISFRARSRRGLVWLVEDATYARPLLIARIQERLQEMKRKPRWTNRNPPEWAQVAIRQRIK